MRVAIITALVQARQEQGISQRQLAEMSHVQQPQIARMERGDANPQLSTILKVLAPLGMTLAVVPINDVYDLLSLIYFPRETVNEF